MKLQVGENIYELEYTVNAVCDLEELTGNTLSSIFSKGEYSGVRALLWCGLTEHSPSMTMRQAGVILQEYLNTGSIEELLTLIGGAFDQAGFPKAQGKAKKK